MGIKNDNLAALFQWIRKSLIIGFFVFLFAFSALLFGIQLPYVQTKLVDIATSKLAKYVNYPIKIGRIKITFTGGLVLQNVVVLDNRKLDMLAVEEIRASFRLLSLFGHDIVLQKLTLYKPNVKLRYYREVDDLNLSDFIASLQHIGQDSAERNKPWVPHVGRYTNFIVKIVAVENAKFSFEDTETQHSTDRFNFSKFSLDSIYMSVSKFKVVGDTVSLKVKNLSCVDEFSRMKIHNMATDFGICENYMKLENLDADVGSSHVSNQIIFRYDGYRQLSAIEDSVLMDFDLKNTKLDTKDVAAFFPELKGFYDKWYVTSHITGYFYDLKADNLNLRFGNDSRIRANASFSGLPNIENMVIKCSIDQSEISMLDIRKYGLLAQYQTIKPFGICQLKGDFEGKYHDFHFEGTADTEIGKIVGNFNLKFDTTDILHTSIYSGVLGLDEFDFQPFGVPDWLQRISFTVKIDGKGFDPLFASCNASGFVNKAHLAGNTYKNAFVSMRYGGKKGLATIDIKDSNVVADVILKADFNNENQTLDIDANILKADIFQLGYYPKPLKVASEIKFKSSGFDINSLQFNLDAKNTTFQSSALQSDISELTAGYSKSKDGGRAFALKSDACDITIGGNFELFALSTALDSLRAKVGESFDGTDNANSLAHVPEHEAIDAAFNIEVKKLNNLLTIFMPKLKIAAGSSCVGQLQTKKGIALNFLADLDSIHWNNISLIGNRFDFLIEKPADHRPISGVFEAASQKQFIDNEAATEDVNITASWRDDIIDFTAIAKQQNENNNANVSGELKVGGLEKILRFKTAQLNFLNSNWSINKNNQIAFKPKNISFDQVEIRSDSQYVSFEGQLSQSPDKEFKIVLENFRAQNLDKIIGKKMEGTVEGFLIVQDFYNQAKIGSNIKVNKLKINKLYIGNITGKSQWDNQNKKIDLNVDVERNGNNMFSLHGNYTPNATNKEEKFNIVAILNKTNLEVFEPFIKDVLSDLQGDATGLVTLRGNFSKPIINGEIDIENGAFKVNYLNTTYYLNEKISINPSGFVLNNIVLDDHQGGLAVVTGGIFHKGFKDFKLRLEGEFKNMSLLNTTFKDNEIYYGNAIGKGNFSLKGTFDALDIYVKTEALRGTKFYIIYNAASNTEGQTYIKFKTRKAVEALTKINKNAAQSKSSRLKITAHLDIDITNDAYAEFILNRNTGDKIAGYGSGQIQLTFDSDNEFSMVGDYTFSENSFYLFTFLNVINKKFAIQPGSKVTWNGDPSNGMLNVTARYEDRISLEPLVDTIYRNVAGIKTPYPVATILYLNGELLKPELTYDIKIYNYPSAIGAVSLFGYVAAFENKIRNNVNEMNTQVFSLLVFRRFLYGTSGLEGAAGSTVSELLTNQLSQIVSELDKNLQIDLRMNGFDRSAFNAMQVRVSYELLDGKVRITRSGSITNSQSQATTSSIIGDVSVEYMLTNDGKFRLKGFTRPSPNALSISSGSQGNSSTGASIMHTTSFSTLNPFDKKKKKKKEANK